MHATLPRTLFCCLIGSWGRTSRNDLFCPLCWNREPFKSTKTSFDVTVPQTHEALEEALGQAAGLESVRRVSTLFTSMKCAPWQIFSHRPTTTLPQARQPHLFTHEEELTLREVFTQTLQRRRSRGACERAAHSTPHTRVDLKREDSLICSSTTKYLESIWGGCCVHANGWLLVYMSFHRLVSVASVLDLNNIQRALGLKSQIPTAPGKVPQKYMRSFLRSYNSQRANYQKRSAPFVVLSVEVALGSGWLTHGNSSALPCKQDHFSFFRLKKPAEAHTRGSFSLQLTGQAKLKGKTIRDLSFLTELLKENVFPPRTGVDPIPKLQGPAAETLDWYSFRQTLKNVSHSSLVHFLSAVFRAPSQHKPLCSSPFALCMDKICSSNCPDPSDTCWRHERGS